MTSRPIILYFLPVKEGGISLYGLHQINALLEQAEVHVLCYRALASELQQASVQVTLLSEPPGVEASWLIRNLSWVLSTVMNAWKLRRLIKNVQANYVLFGAFSEYWAPLWAWILRPASRTIPFGVIVHDPVRDYQVGPRWWHEWSVSLVYGLMRDTYVHAHGATLAENAPPPIEIPHGIYEPDIEVDEERPVQRADLGIPETAWVILSFGHIRDAKNLDLLIRSLPSVSDAHLLVVGREQSSHDQTVSDYRELAVSLKVENRCSFVNEFVSEASIPGYFAISDCLALTYSASFRSASGVLSTNAAFRLPVLASGGQGPLIEEVERYHLGMVVAPDSLDALIDGVQAIRVVKDAADWESYVKDHGWKMNASRIIDRVTA